MEATERRLAEIAGSLGGAPGEAGLNASLTAIADADDALDQARRRGASGASGSDGGAAGTGGAHRRGERRLGGAA